MTSYAAELDRLSKLSYRQINKLARDPDQPADVRHAARDALEAMSVQSLRAAVADFQRATPVFADFAKRLTRIAEVTRASPRDETTTAMIKTIGDLSGAYAAIGDMIQNPLEEAERLVDVAEAQSTLTVGRVSRSITYADIAGEYQAMFDAATPSLADVATIDRVCDRLLTGAETYQAIQSETGVPWAFIGVVHGLEASFRMDRHLHNGDPLAARTVNAPAGRPSPAIGSPPFDWSVSAADALRGHRLHLIDEWSLPRQLYELERFNGFGYRYRRLPSPYLWSGSNQYSSGKFVRDGVFDSEAVSRQIGGAVVLKQLATRGALTIG